MARNEKSFSEMVEELEDHEDVVECKECFELFPKVDCMKAEHGYICPTCGRGGSTEFVPTSKDITIDLFDQDFPEYEGKTCDADCIKDVFDALIEDEVDAIEGYEEAEAALVRAELPNKEEVEATFEHIKEEEEEHIEELSELVEIKDEEISEEKVEEIIEDSETEPVEEAMSDFQRRLIDRLPKMTKDEFKTMLDSGDTIRIFYGDPREPGVRSRDYEVTLVDGVYEVTSWEETYNDDFTDSEPVEEFDNIDDLWDFMITFMEDDDFSPEYNYLAEALTEHVNEEHPAIESDQELEGTDNAVVKCKAAKVIAHSEDEKPVDCKNEKKPLEKPLTESRVAAYNAAQEKANDLNQSIVYGYSSSKDGSFKELELTILEPGYEEDMENIYDDFGVLYVAYPGKTLHESLEEACNRLIEKHQLSEGPLSKIKDKFQAKFGTETLDKLFDKGYFIAVIRPDKSKVTEHGKLVKTFKDAEKAAKALSAKYADSQIHIIPKAIETKKLSALDPELQKLIDQKNSTAATLLIYNEGKESKSRVNEFINKIKLIAKTNEKLKSLLGTNDDSVDAARDILEPENKGESETTEPGKTTPVEASTNEPEKTSASETTTENSPAEAVPETASEEKPAEETAKEKPEDKTTSTKKRDMSKQNRAKVNSVKIIKALQNAGFDISDLRDGKKATDKLKQLRRDIFGESLEGGYDEDEVECTWCEERFPKSECRFEVGDGGPDGGLGWLCSRCEAAIKSRGEDLTFRENSYWDFLDEQ